MGGRCPVVLGEWQCNVSQQCTLLAAQTCAYWLDWPGPSQGWRVTPPWCWAWRHQPGSVGSSSGLPAITLAEGGRAVENELDNFQRLLSVLEKKLTHIKIDLSALNFIFPYSSDLCLLKELANKCRTWK